MIERVIAAEINGEDLRFRDEEDLRTHLYALEGIEVTSTGRSRDGLELFGFRFGEGGINVSIVAGCHADEPVGPMTAQIVSRILRNHFPELLERFRFHIVPEMNPDGAERNRPWFSDPPALGQYLARAVRELPGDDLEFGFGEGGAVRPECKAAQGFLRRHAPFGAHFSLHGMGFAEGAWCLICKEWAERGGPFMDAFSDFVSRIGFGLHDVDRGGEKGFTRIREGFSTSPTSVAMKEHFLGLSDRATARRFMPSSMEWIQSLGGDPVCIVSEIPLFRIGLRSPSPGEPITKQLKEDLEGLMAQGAEAWEEGLSALETQYQLTATPLELQVRHHVAMIVLALTSLSLS